MNQNIKDYCVSCDTKMANNEHLYNIYGNYCIDCSSRIGHIASIRVLVQKDKLKSKKAENILGILKERWSITIEDIKKSQKNIDVIEKILKC